MTNYEQGLPRTSKVCILCILLILVLLGLSYLPTEALSIPPEFWDNVACIGWGVLPVVLCWVGAAFALNLRAYRTKALAEAELIVAHTWHQRSATKAMRRLS